MKKLLLALAFSIFALPALSAGFFTGGGGGGQFAPQDPGTTTYCWTSNGAASLPTWQPCGAGGGANTALSNLASTNINSALLAQTAIDIGSLTKPFRNIYLSGGGTFGSTSFQITGTPTAARTITLPDLTGTVALTTNNLSVFATTTSAQLFGVVTDKIGSGLLVGNNGPTFIVPILGAATATSINGLGITTTTGILTIPNGVTITGPPSSATVATLGLTNTFTGRQDASGAASTSPNKVGTSVPGTCTVGDMFFKSDATAGQNLYECGATNVYTQQLNSGGGGSGATPALDNLASVNINAALLAQTGIDLGSTTKPFRNVFFYGSGTYGTNYFEFTGTPTGTRVLTLPDLTDTVSTSNSIKTFTNTTYDTAGAGNSFSIAGVAVNANSGTGAVVRVTSAALVTPNLGTASATTLALTGSTAPANGIYLSTANTISLSANSTQAFKCTSTDCTALGTLTSTGNITAPNLAPLSGSLTSGGVLWTDGTNIASTAALTANRPVIGGGAGVAPSVGTVSGNTTQFVTTTGAQTSGNCVSIDASGNHVAAGAGCGSSTAANPTGTVGLTAVNGSAGTFLRSDGAPPLSQAIAPTWTGLHVFAVTARSSGVANYLTITAPADTALTASTESVGVSFAGATRQHATGALTTQREIVFSNPTYSFVGASTITNAATVAIVDAPGTGTNATLTNKYALWIQAGDLLAAGLIKAGSGPTTLTDSAGKILAAALNTATVAVGGTGLTSGTSGGVLGYTASGTLASSIALTANMPVIGGGAGATPTVGTVSGNTTQFVTTTGAQTSGNCVSIDASGNHVAAGAGCGSSTAANPTGTVGLTAVNGSAGTFLRSDGAPPLSQAIAPTWTGLHNFAITARSSGVANYFTITAPADTALTASTESIGVNFAGATRQHATGALTTQREVVFNAPSYSFVGASTLTNAATVAIADAPGTGTNATITNKYALWVQSGDALFAGLIKAGTAPTTLTDSAGKILAASVNTIPISTGLSGFGTGIAAALAVNTGSAGAPSILIAAGTSAMGTGAITSGTCASAVTTSATGTATTDALIASFNSDPTAVTGYVPLTTGMLTIIPYPTTNNVNFKVCNNTAGSITPGAITLNWRVVR